MADLPFLTGEHGRGPLLVVLFFISVTVIIMWGSWAGTLPLGQESATAEMGREIASGGGLWPARLGGEEVDGTAPAGPWLAALVFSVFGAGTFTARLPFMLLSVGILILTFIAGKKGGTAEGEKGSWIDPGHATGLLAAVILALSAIFGKYTTHVTNMIPFAFFMILSAAGWLELPRSRRGIIPWMAGIAGGVLSAGPGGFLAIPAVLAASIFDRERRKVLADPLFAVSTIAVAAVMVWFLAASGGAGKDTPGSIWVLFNWGGLSPAGAAAALVFSLKDIWVGTLPWSIAATVAVGRGIFAGAAGRRWRGFQDLDWTCLWFSLFLFVPAALSQGGAEGALVSVIPFVSILAAREVGRRISGASKLWTLDQVLISLMFLLMLLLVATPLVIHEVSSDPEEDLARTVGKLAPAGQSLGNFRFGSGPRLTRIMFYSGRRVDREMTDPEDVARVCSEMPGKVFLANAPDFRELHETGFHYRLNIIYRTGDLIAFDLNTESDPGDQVREEDTR